MSLRRRALECATGLGCMLLAAALGKHGPALIAPARADVPAPSAAARASASAAPTPSPQRELPEPVTSYALEAELDAAKHEIRAKGTLVLRNATTTPLTELYFHLYLNAFKNERSVFLRSPFGEGRGAVRAGDWGYIDVQRCVARELGGIDLWPARELGTPEEPDDETDVRVPLPRPLEPGATLTLELAFQAKLPAVILRTGYAGSFHLVGQWFPKLARLEPDGSFAHFPFHPQAEFYADFGDYDVTLDVPAHYVVGATGVRTESRVQVGRRRERYRAQGVHDFAWTAWPDFEERTRRLDGVEVRLLSPPGSGRIAEITFGALARALPYSGARFGRYPYPNLTVVHPPEAAAQAGGMEYPTLITTGGPWYAGLLGDRALESVTVHELLHQWFYGLVATNEARWPFLDEGLTTYAELGALESAYGTGSAFRGFGLELSATSLARVFGVERGEDAPVSSPARDFPGFRTLAGLVYSRTATILETFARVYGQGRVEAALRAYAQNQRFRHPSPKDLIAELERELGSVAARTFERAVHERGQVDFLLRDLQSVEERPAAGVFDRAQGRETLPAAKPAGGAYRGRVVVVRRGTLEFPVEIELVDDAGRRTRERWDGRQSFHVVEWRGSAPLAYAVVDPERRVLLDDNLLNNAVAARPSPPHRTLERATYAAELAFALFGP